MAYSPVMMNVHQGVKARINHGIQTLSEFVIFWDWYIYPYYIPNKMILLLKWVKRVGCLLFYVMLNVAGTSAT